MSWKSVDAAARRFLRRPRRGRNRRRRPAGLRAALRRRGRGARTAAAGPDAAARGARPRERTRAPAAARLGPHRLGAFLHRVPRADARRPGSRPLRHARRPTRSCACIGRSSTRCRSARASSRTRPRAPRRSALFYHGVYHTLVVAPATSNTVAKCVFGISDTLATNVFAQAGKCRVPVDRLCLRHRARDRDRWRRRGMVKVYPRRIDLENIETPARASSATTVVETLAEPRDARSRRRGDLACLNASLFLTGHLAKRAAGTGPRRPCRRTASPATIVDIGRQGRGADDRGDHQAPRCSCPIGADRVVLPGRCRGDLGRWRAHFGMPFERGPDELADLPAYLGRAGGRARSLAPRHAHLRRDRRCAALCRSQAILARARSLARDGRRRDRSRLPAGHAVSAPRGERARAEGTRASRSASIRPTATSSPAARGRCRLSAQPQRGYPRPRRRDAAVPGARPGARRATWPRSTAPIDAHAGGRPALHRRPDSRPDPFRLRRLDRALCRSCARALARRRDPDGHRQPHRTDRRRQPRRHRPAARHRARNSRSAMCSSSRSARTRRRTVEEHDAARRVMYAARGGRAAAARATARALLSLHDKRPFADTPEEIAAHAAATCGREFPHRGRRGRHARLQPRGLHASSTDALALFPQPRRRGRRRPCLLSRRRTREGGDRLAARQALRAGRAPRLGLRRRPPAEDATAFKEAGHTLRARVREGGS